MPIALGVVCEGAQALLLLAKNQAGHKSASWRNCENSLKITACARFAKKLAKRFVNLSIPLAKLKETCETCRLRAGVGQGERESPCCDCGTL